MSLSLSLLSAAAEVVLVVLLVDNPTTGGRGRSPNNEESKPPFEESSLGTLVAVPSNGMEPGAEEEEWTEGELCWRCGDM
jgi:hypothetical protein